MIYKKQYGQPFDTESVVGSFLPMMETIPYLTKEPDGFSYAMEPQDVLYGLGENVRGINKRGWVYEKMCIRDRHGYFTSGILFSRDILRHCSRRFHDTSLKTRTHITKPTNAWREML